MSLRERGEGREGEGEGDIKIKSNLFITVGGSIYKMIINTGYQMRET